jgi:hypothetical protein
VLIKVQHPINIILPTIAFASPPPSDPGAGVLAVNISQLIAAKPFKNKTLKIHNKKSIPTVIAVIDKKRPILLLRFRLLKIDALIGFI